MSYTYFINEGDYNEMFYKNNYVVYLEHLQFYVNADSTGDAIDILIDYLEINMPGFLFDREEEFEEEYLEDYTIGGNHSRFINTHNISIIKIGR